MNKILRVILILVVILLLIVLPILYLLNFYNKIIIVDPIIIENKDSIQSVILTKLYALKLTEYKKIILINETHLMNHKKYLGQITENQQHLMLKLEKNNGNTIVTDDKLKRMEEKIKELEQDFKQLLIKRSN